MKEKKILDIIIETKEELTLENFAEHIRKYINYKGLAEDNIKDFIDEINYISTLKYDDELDSYYATIQVKTIHGRTNGTLKLSNHLLDQIWFEKILQFGISIVIVNDFKERNKDEKQYNIKVYEYQFKDSFYLDADAIGKFFKNMFSANSVWDIKNINFGTAENHI